jgi:UDP-N-acetylglucosamine transferase subunit ALG13
LILLSLGTHQQAFSRALDLIEPLAQAGTRFVIQHGSTPCRPQMPNADWVEFMSYREMVETMRQAEGVICHAGVGTIMTALKSGHTPVVIPRQAQYDEHVDDHQHEIATHFAARGMVRCVTDGDSLLPSLLAPRDESGVCGIGKGSAELRAAVANAVVAKPAARRRTLATLASRRRLRR